MSDNSLDQAEKNEGDTNHIEGRLKLLMDYVTGGTHKSWKTLEDETSIKAEKWRQFHRGSTKASSEMIEAIARRWPDYAYWLACGDTEPERGHIAPENFPGVYPIVRGVPQKWATAERNYKQKLLRDVPAGTEEKTIREERIKEEVFKVREKQRMPAVQLCYERIMRTLKQESKDDLFLLEYDNNLRNIRLERWKEELKIQKAINSERVNLGDSIHFESILEKIISGAKFWK